MRVGLIRHFPVELRWPRGWRTAAELDQWQRAYNASPTMTAAPFDLGTIPWQACLSSDLERAVATAKAMFGDTIVTTPLLREAEVAPFRTGNLRLPVLAWRWMLRWAWMTGHRSQRSWRDDFRRRVLAAADEIEGQPGDVLVVSHAGMMWQLSAELRRRGFAGPKLGIPKHATLYTYERGVH